MAKKKEKKDHSKTHNWNCIRLVFVFVVTVTRYLTEIILLLTYSPDQSIIIIIIIIIIITSYSPDQSIIIIIIIITYKLI